MNSGSSPSHSRATVSHLVTRGRSKHKPFAICLGIRCGRPSISQWRCSTVSQLSASNLPFLKPFRLPQAVFCNPLRRRFDYRYSDASPRSLQNWKINTAHFSYTFKQKKYAPVAFSGSGRVGTLPDEFRVFSVVFSRDSIALGGSRSFETQAVCDLPPNPLRTSFDVAMALFDSIAVERL